MTDERITSRTLNQSFRRIEHPSGLTILLCPMKGFSSAYALFGAGIGSVDTNFKTVREEDFVDVPAGVAHFLEHKMFESQDGDSFAQYAKTGANANAFTSFDRTAYLFSCTENFRESLKILIEQVTTPYFTQETVDKEQGIIGQEIRMYDDSPDWRVMFNLLGAVYWNHPVKIDIAGTQESIAEITADLLYRCYHTFYNLKNMVLAVAGNFEESDVLELVDEMLSESEPVAVERREVTEPRGVREHYTEQILPVALPIFEIGFKGEGGDSRRNVLRQIANEILMDIICGESSPLYRQMYDSGLINGTFGSDIMAGRDYLLSMFGGESRNPQEVYRLLCEEISRLKREGIPPEDFRRCRKAAYGRYLEMYCKVESVANLMMTAYFAGIDNMYDLLEMVRNLTLEQLAGQLEEDFNPEYSAISVIKPLEEEAPSC